MALLLINIKKDWTFSKITELDFICFVEKNEIICKKY